MKIKTYPLQFTEEYLKEIETKAKEKKKNIKEIMKNDNQKKLKKEKKE